MSASINDDLFTGKLIASNRSYQSIIRFVVILVVLLDQISAFIYDGISAYQALEGEPIDLPCNISTIEWDQDKISLIAWYRSTNHGNPIYSIDNREASSTKQQQRQQTKPMNSKGSNDRFRMNFDRNPPVLQIDSIKFEDHGDYRCRVDYRMNRTKHFLIHLNITGSPPPIVIWRNQNGKIIDDSYETIIEKQKNLSNSIIVRNRLEIIKIDRSYLLQEFRCEAFSSNIIMTNNISSSMLSNNSIIEINSNFSDDHRNRRISTSIIFDLNLRPLSVKIQMPNFQLDANRSLKFGEIIPPFFEPYGLESRLDSSPAPSLSSSQSLLSFASMTTTISSSSNINMIIDNILTVSAGKAIEILCRSIGSRPSAELTWWKGSRRLPTAASRLSTTDEDESLSLSSPTTSYRLESNLHSNITLSILTFVPTFDDDGQRLTCRADNPLLNEEELEDSIIISVRYAPQLKLSLGSKIPENIREGSDVYFECASKSNPPLIEVIWLFENKPLRNDPSAGLLLTNQSLVRQRINRDHRGNYQCAASNPEGISLSNKVFLNVHFAPVCKPTQKIIYGIARNEQAIVSCEVEAEPVNFIKFRWFFNNSFDNYELPRKDYAIEILQPNFSSSVSSSFSSSSSSIDNEPERGKTYWNKNILHEQFSSLSNPIVPNLLKQFSLENLFQRLASINYFNFDEPSLARSNATYSPRSRAGYGILYCLAENSVGIQRDPCVFTIVEAGPPNPVHDCRIVNVTMTSFILECTPGENGGLRQIFHLEVYNIEKEHLQGNLTSMDEPRFAVENLPHDTAFLLNVFSTNIKGRSDSITLRTATSAYAAKQTTNGKKPSSLGFEDLDRLIINPIFGALIVASISLILLCFASVMFIRNRFCLMNSSRIRQQQQISQIHSQQNSSSIVATTSPSSTSSVFFSSPTTTSIAQFQEQNQPQTTSIGRISSSRSIIDQNQEQLILPSSSPSFHQHQLQNQPQRQHQHDVFSNLYVQSSAINPYALHQTQLIDERTINPSSICYENNDVRDIRDDFIARQYQYHHQHQRQQKQPNCNFVPPSNDSITTIDEMPSRNDYQIRSDCLQQQIASTTPRTALICSTMKHLSPLELSQSSAIDGNNFPSDLIKVENNFGPYYPSLVSSSPSSSATSSVMLGGTNLDSTIRIEDVKNSFQIDLDRNDQQQQQQKQISPFVTVDSQPIPRRVSLIRATTNNLQSFNESSLSSTNSKMN
ncbi:B-cell receptor CD22 [Sarcoptes scabiei]|uniref:B-cell receptor CD22 n=1 Tax=Sarcoptes scabiei TaxID=52283 RepID=A0A834R375_SARSC|nr:B-cell receptor CD22 [Sarcoptes scabiei]